VSDQTCEPGDRYRSAAHRISRLRPWRGCRVVRSDRRGPYLAGQQHRGSQVRSHHTGHQCRRPDARLLLPPSGTIEEREVVRRPDDERLAAEVLSRKRFRYCFGEAPMRRWKAARTEAGAPSPVRRPMLSTGSAVVSNSSRARSRRASASQAIGGAPVSSRNRRVSVRRDMCACSASVSRSSGRARFSSIQSRRGPSWSPRASGRSRSMN